MSRRTTDSSTWGRWTTVLVAVALVAAGAVVGTVRPWEVDGGEASPADPPAPPLPPPVLAAGPSPETPVAQDVQDAVDDLVTDAAGGGTIGAAVVDVATGEQLYAHGADEPITPASTVKLVTGVTVLATLGPAARLPTTVVAGEEDGEVVLVGGGDPTLAADDDAFFPDAARLDALADQVTEALGDDGVTQVTVDAALFDPPVHGPWTDDIPRSGYVGPITALTLDGARRDPDPEQGQSPVARYPEPDLATGEAFAQLLGLDTDAVSRGTAPAPPGGVPDPTVPVTPTASAAPPGAGETVDPADTAGPSASAAPPSAASPSVAAGADGDVEPGTPLGQVRSPPVQSLVDSMLSTSDNTLAETLARHVALARGEPATFDGTATAMAEVLEDVVGVPLADGTLADGSGLSRDNDLTADFLTTLLRRVAADPPEPTLAGVFAALSVAAWSGTLESRYLTDDGEPEPGPAAGTVRAKTGSLTGVNALAGTVTTDDGRPLVFALLTEGQTIGSGQARLALDDVVAALATCQC